jgi:hypothetical protein
MEEKEYPEIFDKNGAKVKDAYVIKFEDGSMNEVFELDEFSGNLCIFDRTRNCGLTDFGDKGVRGKWVNLRYFKGFEVIGSATYWGFRENEV